MTSKRKENNGFRFFLGIIVLGIVIYFGVYTDKKLESNRKQEDKEYVKIDKYDKVIQGRLISKKKSKGYTGRTLMILNNNMKISFSGLARNYEITKADFDYFLQILFINRLILTQFMYIEMIENITLY